MPVLLDTDVAIELLRGSPSALARVAGCGEPIFVSPITAAELYFGAFNSSRPEENAGRVEKFLAEFPEAGLTADAARTFGELKAKLRRRSVQVAPMDLLIAAIALRHGCTLATGIVRHFRNVQDLRVENWIR